MVAKNCWKTTLRNPCPGANSTVTIGIPKEGAKREHDHGWDVRCPNMVYVLTGRTIYQYFISQTAPICVSIVKTFNAPLPMAPKWIKVIPNG